MKAKYIFIHAEGEIKTDTVIYTVMLGTSQEDRKVLERCQSFKFLTSVFFQRYDDSVATFVLRIAQSLFPDVLLPTLRLQRQTINGRQFNKLLNDRIFTATPHRTGTAEVLCLAESKFHHKHHQLWNRK